MPGRGAVDEHPAAGRIGADPQSVRRVIGQVVGQCVRDAGPRLIEPIADLCDLELVAAPTAAKLVIVQPVAKDVIQLAHLRGAGNSTGIDPFRDLVQELAEEPEALEPVLGGKAVPGEARRLDGSSPLADQAMRSQPLKERFDVRKGVDRPIALVFERVREFDEELVG